MWEKLGASVAGALVVSLGSLSINAAECELLVSQKATLESRTTEKKDDFVPFEIDDDKVFRSAKGHWVKFSKNKDQWLADVTMNDGTQTEYENLRVKFEKERSIARLNKGNPQKNLHVLLRNEKGLENMVFVGNTDDKGRRNCFSHFYIPKTHKILVAVLSLAAIGGTTSWIYSNCQGSVQTNDGDTSSLMPDESHVSLDENYPYNTSIEYTGARAQALFNKIGKDFSVNYNIENTDYRKIRNVYLRITFFDKEGEEAAFLVTPKCRLNSREGRGCPSKCSGEVTFSIKPEDMDISDSRIDIANADKNPSIPKHCNINIDFGDLITLNEDGFKIEHLENDFKRTWEKDEEVQ